MNDGSCNEAGCFRIKKRTDATKLTNVRIARFRQCRDLIRESEVFVKYEAKVTSSVSSVERRVIYFSKLLFKPNEKKFSYSYSYKNMQSYGIYVSVGIVGLLHVRARQCTSTPSLREG